VSCVVVFLYILVLYELEGVSGRVWFELFSRQCFCACLALSAVMGSQVEYVVCSGSLDVGE
jgi:hypothetical protein